MTGTFPLSHPISVDEVPQGGATVKISADESERKALAEVYAVAGVDATFWRFVAANRQRYPLGVDLILCAGDRVVGLPRSLSVIV